MTAARHPLRRTALGSAAAVLCLAATWGDVRADPQADALATLQKLSSEAVASREAVTAAQREVDATLAAQSAADVRHRADAAALARAGAALAPHQEAVNRIAAMEYVSGRDGQAAAALTATSPQRLIDGLALQQVVAATITDQMKVYRDTRERAAAAAQASEQSAVAARTAADRAAAVRAELQAKLGELLRKLAAAEAQYAALSPQQRAAVDAVPAVAMPPGVPAGDLAPPPEGAGAPIPEDLPVGVASEAGLQPNAVLAARAVSRQFPQIADIDGVRPDSKPWHPSGLAIDIMIPDPESPEGIALGDQIRDYAMSNAARFGLQDVIWRGTYYTPAGPQASGYLHYDHVHITVTRR